MDNVCKPRVRMEDQVTRPVARLHLEKGRLVWNEDLMPRGKTIGHDPVQSQIDRQQMPPDGIDHHAMRMRSRLTIRFWARTLMLEKCRRSPERAVGLDGESRNAAR